MTDYKIAIRSYDRSNLFPDKTYKMLQMQKDIDLENRLYIFVADEEEKEKYKASLGNSPYREIVVAKKGGKEVNKFMGNFFEEGENVFFLDDDHIGFFEFNELHPKATPILNATNMHEYLLDGFKTIEAENKRGFIFRNIQNAFWLKHSPFKELKPAFFYGGAYGIRNDPYLLESFYSQCDDCERTAKILELDQSVLVYNWAGIIFRKGEDYGANAGGMQTSGDRKDNNEEVLELYAKSPLIRKYFNEPVFSERVRGYDLPMKKLHIPRNRRKWQNYFEQETELFGEWN